MSYRKGPCPNQHKKSVPPISYDDMTSAQKLKQTAVDLEVIASENKKKRAKTRLRNKETKKEDTKQQLLEFRIVR